MNYNLINKSLSGQSSKLNLDCLSKVKSFLPPEPKYKKYQTIKLSNGSIGLIDDKPIWNNWSNIKPQWYYQYSYGLGGTSEGYILESAIIPAN